MLFNSYEFLFIFLPISIFIYFLVNKFNKYSIAKCILIIFSLYFYGYLNPSYITIIIISIVINYSIGKILYQSQYSLKVRKLWMILGIVFNISLLGYFKYYDFLVENINNVFNTDFKLIKIMLPLGISFFTFQQISFIIDSYKRKNYQYSFLSYCLFVTFFPQLVAGPIVLPSEMLPQFEKKVNKRINYNNMNKGLYLLAIGLAKKVIIADTIASFANAGFNGDMNLSILEAWLTSLSYTFQLYFDFSGYCDIAMGVALMFNIILPLNFNSPYKSSNIQEFWKKWHITLGRFLTTYIYFPLGGSRNGRIKTLRNLFIVFLISGIWHGAGWTFIIWGILHGISMIIHRMWKERGYRLNRFFGIFLTFNFVNIFWIFFRASTVERAFSIMKSMLGFTSNSELISNQYRGNLSTGILGVEISFIIFIIAIIICFGCKNSFQKSEKFTFNLSNSIEILSYVLLSLMLLGSNSSFLYFNF